MKLDQYCISDENYYDNTTFISFVITRHCDAGCWYCHWNGETDKTNDVNFDDVLKFIDIQDNENIHFTFYGGEPTESENLISYMNILNNRYKNLQMVLITNLLKPISYFNMLSGVDNLKLIASYHSDSVSDNEEWLDKINLFDDIHIRLMMTENNKNGIIKLWDSLMLKGYDVHIKTIEQMGIVHESDCDPETPITNKLPRLDNFKHMMCSSGFIIRENGDVFKCWEDKVRLMNINNFTYKINKWGLCLHDVCTCGQRFPKLSIRKYRDGEK